MFQQFTKLKAYCQYATLMAKDSSLYSPMAFHYNQPITELNTQRLVSGFGYLPDDFLSFLTMNDGAVIFLDDRYGQSGIRIHGSTKFEYQFPSDAKHGECVKVDDLFTINQKYREYIPETAIIFATCVGDLDILVFLMTDQAHPEASLYCIQDFRDDEPVLIAKNFSSFIELIITYEGEKWWELRENIHLSDQTP